MAITDNKSDLFNYIFHYAKYNTSGDDVQWSISLTDDGILLVFAESNSKIDWVNNFNFPVFPYRNQKNFMLVSKGWGNAWKSCNDEVMSKLIEMTEIFKSFPKVVISGFSYGGAIAQLAAEDFNFRTGKKADVITFGSPKPFFGFITRKHIRNSCNSIENYKYANDIVPLMPPFIGWKNAGKKKVGKFNIKEVFNPENSHLIYGKLDY